MLEPQKLDDVNTKVVNTQTSHRHISLAADDELLEELGYKAEFRREFSVRGHVARASDIAKEQEIRWSRPQPLHFRSWGQAQQ